MSLFGHRRMHCMLLAIGLVAMPALAHSTRAGPRADGARQGVATDGPGLKVHRSDVLFGNARKTTSPAEIDLARCVAATPEARKIADEGTEKGSAKYSILMSKAHARVRRVVKEIAVQNSADCVVKKGSYQNPNGLQVMDMTDDVVTKLEASG